MKAHLRPFSPHLTVAVAILDLRRAIRGFAGGAASRRWTHDLERAKAAARLCLQPLRDGDLVSAEYRYANSTTIAGSQARAM